MKTDFFLEMVSALKLVIKWYSSGVIDHMVALWKETTLAILLSNYELQNIFNADELRLFCHCLRTMIYQLSSEKLESLAKRYDSCWRNRDIANVCNW